jgi:hypothetical protein
MPGDRRQGDGSRLAIRRAESVEGVGGMAAVPVSLIGHLDG